MYLTLPFYKNSAKSKRFSATVAPRIPSRAEATADEVMYLFETCGAQRCTHAPVSLKAHLVQCAMLAMEEMSELPVIIGALLHDVGAMLQEDETAPEDRGAAYLRDNGFSERVCAIAAGQTAARRYLLATDTPYAAALSPAHRHRLQEQGGQMTPAEAEAFEHQPFFKDIVNVCRWDAAATGKQVVLYPVSYFRRLLWDHLSRKTV